MKATGTLRISHSGLGAAHAQPRRLGRAAALSVGVVPVILVSSVTDVALYSAGIFPQPGQAMGSALFLIALSYRIAYGAACCYWVSRRLALGDIRQYLTALTAIGLAISTALPVVMWDGGPAWYPLALIAIVMPCACLGDNRNQTELQ